MCTAWLILWLLMTWIWKEPGHQQPWYWHSFPKSLVSVPKGSIISVTLCEFAGFQLLSTVGILQSCTEPSICVCKQLDIQFYWVLAITEIYIPECYHFKSLLHIWRLSDNWFHQPSSYFEGIECMMGPKPVWWWIFLLLFICVLPW